MMTEEKERKLKKIEDAGDYVTGGIFLLGIPASIIYWIWGGTIKVLFTTIVVLLVAAAVDCSIKAAAKDLRAGR